MQIKMAQAVFSLIHIQIKITLAEVQTQNFKTSYNAIHIYTA
jgi:hypothetical protein